MGSWYKERGFGDFIPLSLAPQRYQTELMGNVKGIMFKRSRKKSSFFSGPTTKRGGGRARPLRKKELFFNIFFLFYFY